MHHYFTSAEGTTTYWMFTKTSELQCSTLLLVVHWCQGVLHPYFHLCVCWSGKIFEPPLNTAFFLPRLYRGAPGALPRNFLTHKSKNFSRLRRELLLFSNSFNNFELQVSFTLSRRKYLYRGNSKHFSRGTYAGIASPLYRGKVRY